MVAGFFIYLSIKFFGFSQVPFLIRVATITAVKRHQVRVSFDGWPDDLSYWLDDDSPDLHPVGWCLKTGHPLEPPLSKFKLCIFKIIMKL